MTKAKNVNLHLIGQWTVIVIGLLGIMLRLEHRITKLEVQQVVWQQTTAERLTRLENKVDNIYSVMSKVIISEEGK